MVIMLALVIIVLLFVSTFGMLELGRRLGLSHRAKHGVPPEGLGALQGTAFTLLGLLLAFTFTGAAERFDGRRALIVQEMNDLGTAWLRLDLLPAERQPAVREAFRAYFDERLAAYRVGPDLPAMLAHFDSAGVRQRLLWRQAVEAVRLVPSPSVTTLVLTSLNEAFDTADERRAALLRHPPATVWVLLGVLTAVCCILAGFDMAASARRLWLHVLLLASLLTVSLYVIVDFEFPRVGLIRLTSYDNLLEALRASMN